MDQATFIGDCAVYCKQALADNRLEAFVKTVQDLCMERWPIPLNPQDTYDERVVAEHKRIFSDLYWAAAARTQMEPIITWYTLFELSFNDWQIEAEPFQIQYEIRKVQRSTQHNLNPTTAAGALVNAARVLPELTRDLLSARADAQEARNRRRREAIARLRERREREALNDGPPDGPPPSPPSPPSAALTRIKKRKTAANNSPAMDQASNSTNTASQASSTLADEDLDGDSDTSTEIIRPKKMPKTRISMTDGLPESGLSLGFNGGHAVSSLSQAAGPSTALVMPTQKKLGGKEGKMGDNTPGVASGAPATEVVASAPRKKSRKAVRAAKKDIEVIVISD
ncbi:hypothetical protein BKA70DRAFT_1441932 [Coprinopsis sp. MPI-PUGE-AT-0042]|nr:hypothetical protein BKA70DRAFT_1441929 [Coprinopsis sp. MPI-PUGE-AT-0042]KAH6890718.1 hypothetical protein BKA70DRAFT_1441932 [Coprinopsis sp. MPI-PUGE-AT-0042]